jgi:hypothetical protein
MNVEETGRYFDFHLPGFVRSFGADIVFYHPVFVRNTCIMNFIRIRTSATSV